MSEDSLTCQQQAQRFGQRSSGGIGSLSDGVSHKISSGEIGSATGAQDRENWQEFLCLSCLSIGISGINHR
jgi:hypothetical protein